MTTQPSIAEMEVAHARNDSTVQELGKAVARIAAMESALRNLVDLHCDWEPQGRATRRFCDHNNALIAAARAALGK